MSDEATETTSTNFSSMGGSSPLSGPAVDHLAQLEATMDHAAAAANAQAAEEAGDSASSLRFDLSGLSDAAKIERLDDIMAQASIAANAQRDLEAEGVDVESGDHLRARDVDGEELEDDDVDQFDDGEIEAASEDESDESDEPAAPRRWTRKEAERVAGELDRAKAQLNEHKGELQRIRESDGHILRALSRISGYTPDPSDPQKRPRYEVLRDKLLAGRATAAERRECNEMTQWHELAGPIYREALRQFDATREAFVATIGASWRQTMTNAVRAEKLEDVVADRLFQSRDPIREAIKIGREIERKAGRPKSAGRPTTAAAAQSQSRPAAPTATDKRTESRSEPGWLTPIVDKLEQTMAEAERKANRQRDRELAELEGRTSGRRSSVA